MYELGLGIANLELVEQIPLFGLRMEFGLGNVWQFRAHRPQLFAGAETFRAPTLGKARKRARSRNVFSLVILPSLTNRRLEADDLDLELTQHTATPAAQVIPPCLLSLSLSFPALISLPRQPPASPPVSPVPPSRYLTLDRPTKDEMDDGGMNGDVMGTATAFSLRSSSLPPCLLSIRPGLSRPPEP